MLSCESRFSIVPLFFPVNVPPPAPQTTGGLGVRIETPFRTGGLLRTTDVDWRPLLNCFLFVNFCRHAARVFELHIDCDLPLTRPSPICYRTMPRDSSGERECRRDSTWPTTPTCQPASAASGTTLARRLGTERAVARPLPQHQTQIERGGRWPFAMCPQSFDDGPSQTTSASVTIVALW